MNQLEKGRYLILSEIGNGGSGKVYKARELHLNKIVAIKQMSGQNPEEMERQIAVWKELEHPGLVRVLDCFFEHGFGYVVMEYVDGISLDQVITEKGAIEETEVENILKQIIEVFRYLHKRNVPIIFQDLKPANIMWQADGTIKLVDFGTVFLQKHDGTMLEAAGTRGYASPEQYRGHGNQIDVRSDIYTIGTTLYSLLSGIRLQYPPYRRDPLGTLCPQLSPGMVHLVDKCIEEKKKDRFSDVDELQDALRTLRRRRFVFGAKGRTKKLPYKKRVKSIYLSAGRKILLACILGFLFGLSGGNFGQGSLTAQSHDILPVTVRGEDGSRMLVRYDSVCPVEGCLLLEVSEKELRHGKGATLTITLADESGENVRARTFFLRQSK